MLPISRWDVGLGHVHLKAPIVLRTQCITSAVSIFGVALFLLGHATAALEFSTYRSVLYSLLGLLPLPRQPSPAQDPVVSSTLGEPSFESVCVLSFPFAFDFATASTDRPHSLWLCLFYINQSLH
ncbi:hypothetical protein HZ326_6658 [Fusarium oxysporum f. sp. albedinis]|nr:hypothetical protein HZ326_6658 [Fusarium oxysporum f. sp. albedinis]